MKVLNVDDSVTMRKIVTLAMNSRGFTVEEAVNGQEALDRITESGDPDLIVLDLNMPVLTGMDFLEEYKGSAPIIVLTTQFEDDIRKKALLKGARAFITKPFKKEDLLTIVNDLGLAG